jgi:hypothetical protein
MAFVLARSDGILAKLSIGQQKLVLPNISETNHDSMKRLAKCTLLDSFKVSGLPATPASRLHALRQFSHAQARSGKSGLGCSRRMVALSAFRSAASAAAVSLVRLMYRYQQLMGQRHVCKSFEMLLWDVIPAVRKSVCRCLLS